MPSTSPRPLRAAKARLATWCIIAALDVTAGTLPAMAQDVPAASSHELLLSVTINDRPTGVLATFKQLPNGTLAAAPGQLQSAGIKSKIGKVNADGLVLLDSLKDVTWRYDEPNQIIAFSASDDSRVPTQVNVSAASPPVDFSSVRADFGSVLNYTLYGTYDVSRNDGEARGNTSTLSGSFESRMLTPFGVVSNTALARVNAFGIYDPLGNGLTRLDSTWRYTDPENFLVYQAGDSIASSLSSGSSYRFGGIQIRRNFDIRSDLVTSPLPNLAGSASVPSTLDLYLNNIKVFSGDVPAGPFDFTGLPFLGGGGDARIVMKDALGREVVTERSYFVASNMLRAGYFDFSTELGFARLGYGDESFDYDRNLVGSASIRYGLTNWLTLEGHAESTRGLVNGGAGFVTSLGPFGAINGSFLASNYGSETGGKGSAFYQVGRNGYSFYVGSDRTFGDYNDIGLIVDRSHGDHAPVSARARQVDRVGMSFPLNFDPSSLSVGYARVNGADKDGDSNVATASWSRTVFKDASVYVSGYADLDSGRKFGIFAGISVPLGGDMMASASVSRSGNHTSFDTSLTKAPTQEEGAIGWSLRDQEVVGGTGSRSASANYRTSAAYLSGSVDQSGDQGRLTGTIEGSIVAAGGDVFLANRVDDAFAVVKAGGPNVDVSLNNRRVASTNSRGRAFVPYLQSYQNNTISIDPTNLSLDLQPDATQSVVIPADRSGAVVDFGVKKIAGAVLSLTGPDGKPIPVGSVIQLDGTDQTTVAGYDGRTWLTGLSSRNGVTVTLPEAAGTCRASFDYKAALAAQSTIGPVPCR